MSRNDYNNGSMWKNFLFFVIKLLNSSFFQLIINLAGTTIISIHVSFFLSDKIQYKDWITKLIIFSFIYLLVNIAILFATLYQKKLLKNFSLLESSFQGHKNINSEMSNQIYRLNNKLSDTIKKNKPFQIDNFNTIADFQTFSFNICADIYYQIKNVLSCDECQITIFQRFQDENNKHFVQMIAYANKNTTAPSSYSNIFFLNEKRKKKKYKTVFERIFESQEDEPIILYNKEMVANEFVYLNGSETREKEICQYIGIPIRTNRHMNELLLQIDVSKEKVLGKNKKQLLEITNSIFIPYTKLLLTCYERDKIFNVLFEILGNNSIKEGD